MRGPLNTYLKPDQLQKVMWLHHQAFGAKDLPCVPCKGGCCHGCAASGGYLRREMTPEAWDALAKEYEFEPWHQPKKGQPWTPETTGRGFQRETGCALPLEKRSATCVGYHCYSSHTKKENLSPRRQELAKGGNRVWTDKEHEAQRELSDLVFEATRAK